jgi:peptidoglycan hydrolase-like protein with peptidoglycan-binding domain
MCGALLLALPASAHTRSHSKHARHSRRGSSSWKRHGQQKIDSERAAEIQQALIREKYLDGEPSGVWDQATKDAMERYQSDHGWQTKSLPDARALIALGLGPKHENLLNPESIAPATATVATPPASALPAGMPMQLVQKQK